jgi:hypothetical protein
VLPTTREGGERSLVAMQYTTKSYLGAIAYQSGGLAFDHGWLRILGAGGSEMSLSLASVNGLDRQPTLPPDALGLIVAVDVLGGVFAVNTGRLPGPTENVFYLAPDTLDWLDMGCRYSRFVQWAFVGKVDGFYQSLRWPGWEEQVAALPLDHGFHVLPPLFAKVETNVALVRKPVPIEELCRLTFEMSRQMRAKGIRDGDRFVFKVTK